VSTLSGAEIDRLLVAVNGSVITEGDLYIARHLNPLIFENGKTVALSREEEIGRLIDLALIRQELRNFSMDSEDEGTLDRKVKEWRDRMARSGIALESVERLGIRESELDSYLKQRISILEFVNFRFGPFARVSDSEIEAYYEGAYRTQLLASGIEVPPLAQVSGRIEGLLKEQKINEALDQWLLDARQNARIEYFNGEGPHGPDSGQPRKSTQTGATE
jgi:hypothetical protein